MPIEFKAEMYGDLDMYVRTYLSLICMASKLNWHLKFRICYSIRVLYVFLSV